MEVTVDVRRLCVGGLEPEEAGTLLCNRARELGNASFRSGLTMRNYDPSVTPPTATRSNAYDARSGASLREGTR